MVVRTFSALETKKLGAELAKKILKSKPKKALLVALSGPLGSGKTTFVQGLFRGLAIRKRALSPTFLIIRKIKIKQKNLYHVDAYRLSASEISKLGFKTIAVSPKNIVIIEWAEKIKSLLPPRVFRLKFDYGRNINERTINFSGKL